VTAYPVVFVPTAEGLKELPAPGIVPDATGSEAVSPPAPEFDADLAPEGHVGPWMPKTIRDVEWTLARISEAEEDMAEVGAQLDAAITTLKQRGALLTEKAERRAAWFRSLAETWAREHRSEVVRGKAKSREMLSGSIGFRAKAEKLVVVDKEKLAAWLEAQPIESGLYRVKFEPVMAELQALLKSTGEMPPGTDLEPATETIQIKTIALPALTAGKKVLP
jgi:hypothetical protein